MFQIYEILNVFLILPVYIFLYFYLLTLMLSQILLCCM